jgi:hypothetical protein
LSDPPPAGAGFDLHGVWDPWGLLVTPPELLPRYADVWSQLLPRGGVWLAVACVQRQPAGPAGQGVCCDDHNDMMRGPEEPGRNQPQAVGVSQVC